MGTTVEKILLDTNVWLDNYIPERVGHETARELLSYARKNGIQLLYAVGTIKDVYYLIAADFKSRIRAEGGSVGSVEAAVAKKLAWSCVENMQALACAVGADESDVWLSGKYRSLHDDLEDDLVLAAGKRASADYLLTNDTALAQHAPVPTLTPSAWLALKRS